MKSKFPEPIHNLPQVDIPMIFIDQPYISDFLRQTIHDNELPVVKTDAAKALGFEDAPYFLDEAQAIEAARAAKNMPIYTNSENAIGWIARNLAFTDLPAQLNLFKDKARFRELIRPLYPRFFFRKIPLNDLDALCIEDFPLPFIIKPTTGFFSMGVHKVTDAAVWERVKTAIHAELTQMQGLFPQEVVDTTSFIIEQCIEGDEFAVDAYFDADGEPVILNILHHLFSSAADVSDRVYISSKAIIEAHLEPFTDFLRQIGALTSVKNFPVHVEIRLDDKGKIQPIEVNPMRFGGWCTTADMTYFAYGFNPYLYFLRGKRPNWDDLLKEKAGKLYSIIILDNSTGLEAEQIASFDYERMLATLEKPLELRLIDYHRFPLFGFVFAETRDTNFAELDTILKSDLSEFVIAR